jgi:hypothetical protein
MQKDAPCSNGLPNSHDSYDFSDKYDLMEIRIGREMLCLVVIIFLLYVKGKSLNQFIIGKLKGWFSVFSVDSNALKNVLNLMSLSWQPFLPFNEISNFNAIILLRTH